MYDMPPVLTGTPQEQLAQLWEYVYKLVERMNMNQQEEQK